MSGLSYFVVEIQAWIFIIESKSNLSQKCLKILKSKSKKLKMHIFNDQIWAVLFH